MTTDKTNRNTTTFTSIIDIATEFEYIHVRFHQIRNLLYIYDEQIERELALLKETTDFKGGCFLKSYDMLRSLMEIMLLNMDEAVEAMEDQIEEVYEANRAARSKLQATE